MFGFIIAASFCDTGRSKSHPTQYSIYRGRQSARLKLLESVEFMPNCWLKGTGKLQLEVVPGDPVGPGVITAQLLACTILQ